MHNVATSETKAIPASQQMPAVVVMAQVSSNHCIASVCALYLCQHFAANVNADTISTILVAGSRALLKAWDRLGQWL